ncbi:hypothetical protein M378DRAFT_167954 [Amanita muscaria Koide BX008]|uniref:Uncharacterized protein n=1 Tax=Amanita muscaria (strain Koide BX008) TaxID=946122 RepID=A0A0C2T291_AMAMK|nr:hypothetical protein M378DRAFT_167954 [Amanita muscaria Koide BX008]
MIPDTIPSNPYVTVASTISYLYRTEGAGVFFSDLVPTLICVTRYTYHHGDVCYPRVDCASALLTFIQHRISFNLTALYHNNRFVYNQ